jgi:hypothetical protein
MTKADGDEAGFQAWRADVSYMTPAWDCWVAALAWERERVAELLTARCACDDLRALALFLMGSLASVRIHENASNRVVILASQGKCERPPVVEKNLETALRVWAEKNQPGDMRRRAEEAPEWESAAETLSDSCLERIVVPGGWLYRSTQWTNTEREDEGPPVRTESMVFVADPRRK